MASGISDTFFDDDRGDDDEIPSRDPAIHTVNYLFSREGGLIVKMTLDDRDLFRRGAYFAE